MTNTMADLRREVAQRLRKTLHGKEIDTIEMGMPEMPHMLGIVTIGAISTPQAVKGSIMDCDHEFWDEYHEEVNTNNKAKKEIKSAMHSLKEDNIFRVTTPYGDDAGIWYCEVGTIDERPTQMKTVCTNCQAPINTSPELKHAYGRYRLAFSLECPSCDFSDTISTSLHLQ